MATRALAEPLNPDDPPTVDAPSPAPERARLHDQLRRAAAARLGVPPSLEQPVRDFARAARVSGMPVQTMIVEVKDATRSITGEQDLVFLPKIVGWAVAGYFAGTGAQDREEA